MYFLEFILIEKGTEDSKSNKNNKNKNSSEISDIH
jgi:hypothetical protein